MKQETLSFPWGQVGLYMAILFWLIAMVTGTVGATDYRPTSVAAVSSAALFVGAVACGGIGLFKPPLRNRLLGGAALVLTLLPVALLMTKS